MGPLRQSLEILAEIYQVSRPAAGLMGSTMYLYNNESANLWMVLYFAFIFHLGGNAANDYMDWERDQADPNREVSSSRGQAKSKNALWWYYMICTAIALLVIPFFDLLYGPMYFLLLEIGGQWVYNGIFLGVPINEKSLIKTYGAPFDILLFSWTYLPFPHLYTIRSFFPSAAISGLSATMLWAQLKDYDCDRDANVKTTATYLGPIGSRLFISLAAMVTVHSDPRFWFYGIYSLYRCWYPYWNPQSKPIGKMTAVLGLNLAGVVLLDPVVDPMVKNPVMALQVLFFAVYKMNLLPALEQKYYAIRGILNRRKPYDASVWKEDNPQVLLWKVGACGRSASAAMSLFNLEMSRFCLMGAVYFRYLDTWADQCLDGTNARVKGLGKLYKHLLQVEQGNNKVVGVQDDYSKVTWDLTSRPRNRMYVDITENVHRFDEVFLSMSKPHRAALLEYAKDAGEGWAELEHRKDEPVTPQLMRRHAEVALDVPFFTMLKVMSPGLLSAIEPRSELVDKAARDAYVATSDSMWLMNLVATIEEDVEEGVALDEELRAMKGIDPDVINQVRIKWIVNALKLLKHSRAFLLHPGLTQNWMLRMFALMFILVCINDSHTCLSKGKKDCKPEVKSGGKLLSRAVLHSLTVGKYKQATEEALATGECLLQSFVAMQCAPKLS